jgi:hypothetical protein
MPWVDVKDVPVIPDELIIGRAFRTESPLMVWADEAGAVGWIEGGGNPERTSRRLFRVRVEILEELEYVPPVAASLRPKGNPS